MHRLKIPATLAPTGERILSCGDPDMRSIQARQPSQLVHDHQHDQAHAEVKASESETGDDLQGLRSCEANGDDPCNQYRETRGFGPSVKTALAKSSVAALIAMIAVAPGCGGHGKQIADQSQVRSVASAFVSAFAAEDYGKLCRLYTTDLKAAMTRGLEAHHRLRPGGCPAWLKYALTNVPPVARHRLRLLKPKVSRYKITSVLISGNTAVVRDNIGIGSVSTGERHLKKEGGRWLVDSIF